MLTSLESTLNLALSYGKCPYVADPRAQKEEQYVFLTLQDGDLR